MISSSYSYHYEVNEVCVLSFFLFNYNVVKGVERKHELNKRKRREHTSSTSNSFIPCGSCGCVSF